MAENGKFYYRLFNKYYSKIKALDVNHLKIVVEKESEHNKEITTYIVIKYNLIKKLYEGFMDKTWKVREDIEPFAEHTDLHKQSVELGYCLFEVCSVGRFSNGLSRVRQFSIRDADSLYSSVNTSELCTIVCAVCDETEEYNLNKVIVQYNEV